MSIDVRGNHSERLQRLPRMSLVGGRHVGSNGRGEVIIQHDKIGQGQTGVSRAAHSAKSKEIAKIY